MELFILGASISKIEQINFRSNLDKAISNLEKHVREEKDIFPMLLMKFPPNASLKSLQDYAQGYFENNPDTVISRIDFFQPYTVSNPKAGSNFIACFSLCAANYDSLKKGMGQIKYIIPGMTITDREPTYCPPQIKDHYVYQYGDIYVPAKNDGHEISGIIKHFAPGIYTSLCAEIDGVKQIFSQRGEDDLLIM